MQRWGRSARFPSTTADPALPVKHRSCVRRRHGPRAASGRHEASRSHWRDLAPRRRGPSHGCLAHAAADGSSRAATAEPARSRDHRRDLERHLPGAASLARPHLIKEFAPRRVRAHVRGHCATARRSHAWPRRRPRSSRPRRRPRSSRPNLCRSPRPRLPSRRLPYAREFARPRLTSPCLPSARMRCVLISLSLASPVQRCRAAQRSGAYGSTGDAEVREIWRLTHRGSLTGERDDRLIFVRTLRRRSCNGKISFLLQ